MTNEEKARELGWENDNYLTPREILIEQKCLEMADWKDQQFIECLEKLQERFVEYDKHSDWEAIQEIINKLKK